MSEIDFQCASSAPSIPREEDVQHWFNTASEAIKADAEACIRIVDSAEIQSLNKTYRQKDKATNVLSFPAEFPEEMAIPHIGDIVICADVVAQEAQLQNKPLTLHWAHMVVHGTLHLLGYDHIEDDQAQEMEAKETAIMAQLGFACPYTTQFNNTSDIGV